MINDFAFRCFRNTADRDYIHARLAYRANLYPQFLWSSLHCLEKYVKCILLLCRIEARNIKHEVTPGLSKIEKIGGFKVCISQGTLKFIERLEETARFRYLETSWYADEGEIVKLDRAVYQIRRYCRNLYIDPENVPNSGLDLDLIDNLSKIDERNDRYTCLNGGLLENIISNKSSPSRPPLVWKNICFGTSQRKRIALPDLLMFENAPLHLNPRMIDEVSKYVFLPKEVKVAYEQLHKSGG